SGGSSRGRPDLHPDTSAIDARAAVQRSERGVGSRPYSRLLLQQRLSERDLRVHGQSGFWSPAGSARVRRESWQAGVCAKRAGQRSGFDEAVARERTHQPEGGRSAIGEPDQREPAETLRPGYLRESPDGDEPDKYLLYQTEEAHKYSLNAGFGAEIARIGGAADLQDPAGATGFSPEVSFGISRLNVLGLGHTVSVQTLLSTIRQRGLFNYLAPQFIGNPNLSLQFTGLFEISRDVRTF